MVQFVYKLYQELKIKISFACCDENRLFQACCRFKYYIIT